MGQTCGYLILSASAAFFQNVSLGVRARVWSYGQRLGRAVALRLANPKKLTRQYQALTPGGQYGD